MGFYGAANPCVPRPQLSVTVAELHSRLLLKNIQLSLQKICWLHFHSYSTMTQNTFENTAESKL